MTNSDCIYQISKRFQDTRKVIVDQYEGKMEKLDSARGSAYYGEESKKAAAERDKELNKLKVEYLTDVDKFLLHMREESASRTLAAPSQDELAIITALKMRSEVSENEIAQAAKAIKSPYAVGVLREIARKSGYLRHIGSEDDSEMSEDEVSAIISSLAKSIRDFADHDTTTASRMSYEHKRQLHGLTGEERLVKRQLFNDKKSCFDELAPYLTGSRREAFFRAVDGE